MSHSLEQQTPLLQNYEIEKSVTGIQSHRKPNDILSNSTRSILLYSLLCISLFINILSYITVRNIGSDQVRDGCLSGYAQLAQDYPDTMQYATAYGTDGSDSETTALWDAVDISEGIVAIPHEWADGHGVPRSQPFPWDNSRDIYVLSGYHNMHCLKLLQAFTSDAHAGLDPSIPYHHVEHCIDVLRQDVLCNADDLPLAQKPQSQGGLDKRPGDGQARMCKSWQGLSSFAQQHNACYKRLNITRGGVDAGVRSEFERYRFCPEGSPYLPAMNAFFGEKNE